MSDEHEEYTLGPLSGAEGKAETARRLCRVLYLVHEKRVGFAEGPCDCVCPEKKGDPRNFRSTGEALRWLEKLVEQLPKAKVTMRVREAWTVDEWGDIKWEPPTITALDRAGEHTSSDTTKEGP